MKGVRQDTPIIDELGQSDLDSAKQALLIVSYPDFAALAPQMAAVKTDAKNRKVVNLAILPENFNGSSRGISPVYPDQHAKWNRAEQGDKADLSRRIRAMAAATDNTSLPTWSKRV